MEERFDDASYRVFVEGVRRRYGIDLGQYKEAQMRRRITSLIRRRGFSGYAEYFAAVERDEELRREFLDRITINVSEFFRNPERWEDLDRHVLAEILAKTTVRLWSAACAGGEEPYTLAMLVHARRRSFVGVTLLATDIDEEALARARRGRYPESAVRLVPPDLAARYLVRDGDEYEVVPELKRAVHFRRHDLLRDPYERGFDLIVNRNVAIYFTDAGKDHLYRELSRSLRPGGYLFVGSTEQIFSSERYGLRQVYPFIYRKVGDPA
ncbi:MAG: protein-glutamate O-methyltransferase CheR [Brockia lithotrophica]|nr:protein-glutamate O-methyltransferase CheR [Brockia lithotrophica]